MQINMASEPCKHRRARDSTLSLIFACRKPLVQGTSLTKYTDFIIYFSGQTAKILLTGHFLKLAQNNNLRRWHFNGVKSFLDKKIFND